MMPLYQQLQRGNSYVRKDEERWAGIILSIFVLYEHAMAADQTQLHQSLISLNLPSVYHRFNFYVIIDKNVGIETWFDNTRGCFVHFDTCLSFVVDHQPRSW